MLYNNNDTVKMRKRVSDTFPGKKWCWKCTMLCNYLEIGIGSGLDKGFAFWYSRLLCQIQITYSYCLQQPQNASDKSQLHWINWRAGQFVSCIVYRIEKTIYTNSGEIPNRNSWLILLRSYTGLFYRSGLRKRRPDSQTPRLETGWCLQPTDQSGKDKSFNTYHVKTPFLTFTHERGLRRIMLGKKHMTIAATVTLLA